MLCDSEFTASDIEHCKLLQLVSRKPCVTVNAPLDIDALIIAVLEKAQMQLFFTVGKKEVRAWSVAAGSTVLEAAGKIHSDLQRGFIKADVVNIRELDNFFNMAEARSRGLVKVVDRDYIMEAGDIIEIRFNV